MYLATRNLPRSFLSTNSENNQFIFSLISGPFSSPLAFPNVFCVWFSTVLASMLSFILTFSPDECQSNSFEKMNTLLSAIFKFCTTKNLLSYYLESVNLHTSCHTGVHPGRSQPWASAAGARGL